MANTILHKRSSTASAVPTTGQLSVGEIAINTTDEKLYINNGTAVVEIGGGAGGGETYFTENFDGAVPAAAGTDALAIGESASASQSDCVSVGKSALATATQSTAIGTSTTASSAISTAVGFQCTASGTDSFAGASTATASGNSTIAIGRNTQATGSNDIALGNTAHAFGGYGVAIGSLSTIPSGNNGCIALGQAATTPGATTDRAIAIGKSASATGLGSIAIGDVATVTLAGGVAIGDASTAGTADSIAIGNGATAPTNGIQLKANQASSLDMSSTGAVSCSGTNAQMVMPTYTMAGGLPTGVTGGMIFISDETGGAVTAFFDGTNWRRTTDRAIAAA